MLHIALNSETLSYYSRGPGWNNTLITRKWISPISEIITSKTSDFQFQMFRSQTVWLMSLIIRALRIRRCSPTSSRWTTRLLTAQWTWMLQRSRTNPTSILRHRTFIKVSRVWITRHNQIRTCIQATSIRTQCSRCLLGQAHSTKIRP